VLILRDLNFHKSQNDICQDEKKNKAGISSPPLGIFDGLSLVSVISHCIDPPRLIKYEQMRLISLGK
jgi:hypothetical protein